jgi:tetratricopeptide (TPR) repeat protein
VTGTPAVFSFGREIGGGKFSPRVTLQLQRALVLNEAFKRRVPLSEGRKLRPRKSLALTYARLAENVTEKKLSERSGIADISALEKKREPKPWELEKLFSTLGRPRPEEIDLALFCADLLLHPEPSASAASPVDPTPEEMQMISAMTAVAAAAVFRVMRDLLRQALTEEKTKAQRKDSERLLKELLSRPARESRRLVEEQQAYRSWALAERAALESTRIAAHDADQALDLARLAVRMAELTPGSREWRARLGGFCWGFLANAHRVKGDFPAADEAFVRSDQLWKAGGAGDPGLALDGTRLLDLKASLRRHQGRFDESLDLLKQALAVSRSDETTVRILLVKSFTLKEMADHQSAIEALQQARPLVESQGDPRARFGLEFNLSASLRGAGRYAEAEELLPKVKRLALELGNGLDLLRVRWLEGLVSAGLGKSGEAVKDLEYVAGELVARGIAFDAGRACLDLAELHLRQGRTAEVKRLAGQIVAVFRAQKVHREALAAVILFQDAAERERATAELARKLSDYLRRAQHDPSLRFES